MNATDLSTELQDLAKALGLIDPQNGQFDWNWFADPLSSIKKVFSNQGQRDAFNELLNALIAPTSIDGIPSMFISRFVKMAPTLRSESRGSFIRPLRPTLRCAHICPCFSLTALTFRPSLEPQMGRCKWDFEST
jgi:hypothetical protein